MKKQAEFRRSDGSPIRVLLGDKGDGYLHLGTVSKIMQEVGQATSNVNDNNSHPTVMAVTDWLTVGAKNTY